MLNYLIDKLIDLFYIEEEEEYPVCYKSNPNYQTQAENCCHNCPYKNECLEIK